ncbi:MAG: TrbC/VirB2 family protein [Allosphingosinicella sp.]
MASTIGKSLTTVQYPQRGCCDSTGPGSFVVIGLVRHWLAAALTAGVMAWSSAAAAQDFSGSDPAGSGVIVSAVRWLQGTLLGTVATVVAVIAVASVGFLMLTGRINWRYGATVILGCFILFGAASIVAGIQSTSSLGN